jgi:putative PEP-CTERM system histidine kinase
VVEIGAIGYGLVGGLYLVLAALLLTVWRGKKIGGYLIAACLVSVAWASLLAVQTAKEAVDPTSLFVAEVLRSGAWIAFLSHLLHRIGGSRLVRYLAQAVWLAVLTVGIALLGYVYTGGAGNIGSVLFPGGLATALTGLILIEQLYRNTPSDSRWSLKWLVLGLGGMFAYDLFVYSQAILFNAIDSAIWIARGPVNLLFVPLIAVAARRNPDWQLRIFVSRQVVFYSTTLTAVGLYLLLMGAGGYLIARYGGGWGALARVVFFTGAGLVLLTLLFSSSLRAKIKVFLSKHFFQNKYDYRREWLRLISTLSRFEGRSTREVVVEALANIVESPGGYLWVLDEDANALHLAAGLNVDEEVPDFSGDDPVVAFLREQGWLIDLAEYKREPDIYGDLELPEWLLRMNLAWLIVPLIFGKNVLGIALLTKAPGLPRLNYEDRDLLKTVGNHIAVHLAQENANSQLAESRQFEAYNRLTAFLMHDLNNLIAQQSLIVTNAEKHKRNPEFIDDAIATIAGSVRRMRKVMEQLKRGNGSSGARLSSLSDIVTAAVKRCAGRLPEPVLKQRDDTAMVAADPDQFAMVLTHLIRNAQDATSSIGVVTVEVDRGDGKATVKVIDNGEGMTREFIRERLFRPFDSTKGAEGMGIGAYQAREFVRHLGGELEVVSEQKKGTTVTVAVPLKPSD